MIDKELAAEFFTAADLDEFHLASTLLMDSSTGYRNEEFPQIVNEITINTEHVNIIYSQPEEAELYKAYAKNEPVVIDILTGYRVYLLHTRTGILNEDDYLTLEADRKESYLVKLEEVSAEISVKIVSIKVSEKTPGKNRETCLITKWAGVDSFGKYYTLEKDFQSNWYYSKA